MEPDELDAVEHDLDEAEEILERLDDGTYWTDTTAPVPLAEDDG